MYGVEPYSTMKPATSSDSASGRSKGGRLVSASAEMKNTTNIGNSASQCQSSSEAVRQAEHRAEPGLLGQHDVRQVERTDASSTVMMTKPMETS